MSEFILATLLGLLIVLLSFKYMIHVIFTVRYQPHLLHDVSGRGWIIILLFANCMKFVWFVAAIDRNMRKTKIWCHDYTAESVSKPEVLPLRLPKVLLRANLQKALKCTESTFKEVLLNWNRSVLCIQYSQLYISVISCTPSTPPYFSAVELRDECTCCKHFR